MAFAAQGKSPPQFFRNRGERMFDARKYQEQVIFEAVKAAGGEEAAEKVVFGDSGKAVSEDNAAWVKGTMARLEREFDRETVKRIRRSCQCGYGMDERIEFAKSLVACSSSMEEFAGHERAREAGLSCVDGVLYLQFPFCPCPMLADVDRLETDTWCQCTTGYSKVLFECAFGCEVDVELLKSVKMGDEICLMKISPRGEVWKS